MFLALETIVPQLAESGKYFFAWLIPNALIAQADANAAHQ
jgi:hypothetical protein